MLTFLDAGSLNFAGPSRRTPEVIDVDADDTGKPGEGSKEKPSDDVEEEEMGPVEKLGEKEDKGPVEKLGEEEDKGPVEKLCVEEMPVTVDTGDEVNPETTGEGVPEEKAPDDLGPDMPARTEMEHIPENSNPAPASLTEAEVLVTTVPVGNFFGEFSDAYFIIFPAHQFF